MESFINGIMYIFVEIIFQGVVKRIIKLIHLLGFFIIKLITFNSDPMNEVKKEYKDSILPYSIGYGVVIVIVYFIMK